ncbi:hypothetical protein BGZ83_007711 [Gryganskiella cystojenkinii]|nr:hypothetical protein BGZ83_007711 [Gryganskiella cystojenkinii]
MPLILQYRAVTVLAVVSAFATISYLSLSTDLNYLYTGAENTYPPLDTARDQHDSTLYTSSQQQQQQHQEQTSKHSSSQPFVNGPPHQQERPISNNKPPTDNNARVAKLHADAFVSFCNTPKDSLTPPTTAFESYNDWIEFVNKKNTRGNGVNNSFSEPVKTTQHPLFLERPPPYWIVNLTALEEPCNRLFHTSAYCLDALSKEHQYLIPSTTSSSATSLIKTLPSVPKNKGKSISSSSSSGADGDANDSASATNFMDFHVFWRGPITDKLSLNAHAFLFTQPLDRSRLHLWIDSADLPGGVPEDYLQNEFAAPLVQEPLNRHIFIHPWDQAAELAYSYGSEGAAPFAADHNRNNGPESQAARPTEIPTEEVKPVALSDEARFLILNRNGGVYLDADVVLLRDMTPFYDSEIEFAYEWSNTRMYNTAILRLLPGSSVARRILDGAKAREIEIMEKKRLEAMLRQQELDEQDAEMNEDEETEEEPHDGENEDPEGSSPSKVHNRKKNSEISSRPTGSNTTASRRRLQSLAKRGEMRPDEIYHPARLRQYLRPEDSKIEGNGLVMMPPAFFDPLWLRVDRKETKNTEDTDKMVEDLHTFPDAFFGGANAVCPSAAPANLMVMTDNDSYNENDNDIPTQSNINKNNKDFTAGPEVFFTGAYAYHWHNNWLTPIDPQSWMGQMRQAYDDFVTSKRPNLYGEWFPVDM